jgi:hypothetical protein
MQVVLATSSSSGVGDDVVEVVRSVVGGDVAVVGGDVAVVGGDVAVVAEVEERNAMAMQVVLAASSSSGVGDVVEVAVAGYDRASAVGGDVAGSGDVVEGVGAAAGGDVAVVDVDVTGAGHVLEGDIAAAGGDVTVVGGDVAGAVDMQVVVEEHSAVAVQEVSDDEQGVGAGDCLDGLSDFAASASSSDGCGQTADDMNDVCGSEVVPEKRHTESEQDPWESELGVRVAIGVDDGVCAVVGAVGVWLSGLMDYL